MAVDTRSRRAAVLGLVGGLAFTPPLVDGTIDQADRQHAAYCYPGILATALVTNPGTPETIVWVPYLVRTVRT